MIRAIVVTLGFISLFIFPWPVWSAALLGVGLVMPLAAFALGTVADLVYFVPGSASIPYFTLLGFLFFMISLLVHRFVKTRIITE